jgi:lipoprotein NlpI
MAKNPKKKLKGTKAESGRRTEARGNPDPWASFPWQTALRAGVIVAAVFLIFSPVFQGEWLWDDDSLITNNLLVHSSNGLWKIWFEPDTLIDYFPLKVSVEWIEWHLWGMDTLGYHLVSIALHAVSALLVWRLLAKFGLRLAWLGGLLFAIHPLMVESVAWISELKNTLSLPPFLLAMCAWLDYDERGRRQDYLRALVLFLVAMLCKTTMVMFPVALLLHAWWKRGRIGWQDMRNSAPFFALSLMLGIITALFLHQHAIGERPIPVGGLFARLALAGLSFVFYFSKCVLPIQMSPMYPKWEIDPPTAVQFFPWLVIAGVFFFLWTKRQGWGRHVLLGLGFFALMLAPFVGLTTASYMTFTWVMDHLLYLPVIGLIGLAVAGAEHVDNLLPPMARLCGRSVAALLLALLAYGSYDYAEDFSSPKSLWTYTIGVNPGAFMAYNDLGAVYAREHQYEEALHLYDLSLRLNPTFLGTIFNVAGAYSEMGLSKEALSSYEKLLKIDPDFGMGWNSMGNVYIHEGRVEEAKACYERAVQLNPDYPDSQNNLGNILVKEGNLPGALEHYSQALRINPDYIEAHNSKGAVLARMGDIAGAIREFQEALRIKPDHAAARSNLEQALQFQATHPAP